MLVAPMYWVPSEKLVSVSCVFRSVYSIYPSTHLSVNRSIHSCIQSFIHPIRCPTILLFCPSPLLLPPTPTSNSASGVVVTVHLLMLPSSSRYTLLSSRPPRRRCHYFHWARGTCAREKKYTERVTTTMPTRKMSSKINDRKEPSCQQQHWRMGELATVVAKEAWRAR